MLFVVLMLMLMLMLSLMPTLRVESDFGVYVIVAFAHLVDDLVVDGVVQ